MIKTFYVSGLSCEACEEKVQNVLRSVPGISDVKINGATNSVTVSMEQGIPFSALNTAVESVGSYALQEQRLSAFSLFFTKLKTYLPLIIMFSAVILFTIIKSSIDKASLHRVMVNFMAGYLLLFGLIKIINWKKFAASYRLYDPIAKASIVYAYTYPAIEIVLGIGYFFYVFPYTLNAITVVIFFLKAYGVRNQLREGGVVQCACLGGFFSIPLTLFTFFEDFIMVVMAFSMLFYPHI